MRRLSGVFLLGLLWLGSSQPGFATRFDVLAGSDYFSTMPGTTFNGVAFSGVPTGPDGSDTTVERLSDVALGTGGPSSGTTPLLMTQLELVSTAPANLGAGVGFYYITLQSNQPGGGTASTGSMLINLTAGDDHTPAVPEGTFTSTLDVFFDIRFGSASGPIVTQTDLVLTNSGASWDANPGPADFLVPGLVGDVTANFHTNKIQNVDINNMDFFPVGAFTESAGGDVHAVQDTQTPEPGTMALIASALLVCSFGRRRAI
jgi:hypothetical protein